MLLYALLIAALGADPGTPENHIEGVVVNGTLGGAPVSVAEVVLRAGTDGALRPIAQTVTDESGRFHFYNLPIEPGVIYLPGANRHGVHYPGPRVRLDVAAPPVKLTVYDAVASPSPLVADCHTIDVRMQAGVVEVTETLLVRNPTLTTYVGELDKKPLTTLALGIPADFERVTFATEFFGRRFSVFDNRLVTDIPWLPGKYEVKFTYHLPAAGSPLTLERTLDLPSSIVRIRADAGENGHVTCNLPRVAAAADWPFAFESSGGTLAAGHPLKLAFGDLPAQWSVHAKWMALTVLAGLIVGTATVRRFRKAKAGTRSPHSPARASRRSPKSAARNLRRTRMAA
jgi:hypothetical protein